MIRKKIVLLIVLTTASCNCFAANKNSNSKYAYPSALAKREDHTMDTVIASMHALGKAGIMQNILELFDQEPDELLEHYPPSLYTASMPITLTITDNAPTTRLATTKKRVIDEDEEDPLDGWYYYDESELTPTE